jgi:hypothetical protein
MCQWYIVEHEHALGVETWLVLAANDERPVQAFLELHGLARVRVVPKRPRIGEHEPVLECLPYEIHEELPLRHPQHSHHTVGELIRFLEAAPEPGARPRRS